MCCVLVFDDGDEKTLRRTSLCLKGERHFAESEVRTEKPHQRHVRWTDLQSGGGSVGEHLIR